MRGESPAEIPTLGTAESQQPVVGWQHRPVVIHNVRVVVVGQDVVEGDILNDVRIVKNELDVLWTVETGAVPELEERLLVLMNGNTWLRELRVEQLPEL